MSFSIATGVNRSNRLGKNRQSLRRLRGNVRANTYVRVRSSAILVDLKGRFFAMRVKKLKPVDIEGPYMKNVGDKFLGGDVLCGRCRYIITTLYTHALRGLKHHRRRIQAVEVSHRDCRRIEKQQEDSRSKQFEQSRHAF